MADGCETDPENATTTNTSDSAEANKAESNKKVCRSETHIVLEVPKSGIPVPVAPTPAPRTKLNNSKVSY
jgi:hypothetical protein